MDAIMKLILTNKQFFLVVLVFAYIVFVIITLMIAKKNRTEKKFLAAEVDALTYKAEVKKEISTIKIEKYVYDKMKITDKPIMIWLFRLAVVAVFTVLGFTLHLLTVFFAFEVLCILWVQIKDQEIEDKIGISRTELINNFLDFYIPSVASGISVRQTFQNYISNYGDKEILDWFYNTEPDKVTPARWAEVINVYNNGIASEDAGLPDKADLYQKEIDRMMEYFNNYKAKVGEIKPICWCYYIGLPVICVMSYNNLPEVWSTGLGFGLVIVLCIFFFLFSMLVQKTKKDSTEKVF